MFTYMSVILLFQRNFGFVILYYKHDLNKIHEKDAKKKHLNKLH